MNVYKIKHQLHKPGGDYTDRTYKETHVVAATGTAAVALWERALGAIPTDMAWDGAFEVEVVAESVLRYEPDGGCMGDPDHPYGVGGGDE